MTTDLLPFALTLQVRDGCLCFQTQRAARLLGRRYDEALRPHGLTNGQFSLLMSLNRPAPPTMGAVAETLGMDRTTLTAMLKPLRRRGLAAVSADPHDRRNRIVALTEAGRATLAAAMPSWHATQDAITAGLGAEGAAALRAMLGVAAAVAPRGG
jgi:DNA-binding MarR family transcriptional regulator